MDRGFSRDEIDQINIQYSEMPKFQTSKVKKKLADLIRLDTAKNISEAERFLIKRFYEECPQGYEVDHIIPLIEGGEHRMDNLQWLTKERNRMKKDLITCDECLPPHCPLGW